MNIELVEMGRRSDLKLVEAIVDYLNKKRGVVTQGQLCSAVGINSDTAQKWLAILHFVLNECPKFTFGKAGRYGVISVLDFDDLPGHSATIDGDGKVSLSEETLKSLADKGIEPGSLRTELASRFDDEKIGLEPVEAAELHQQTTPASSVLEADDRSMKFAKAGPGFLPTLRQELTEKFTQRLAKPPLTERDQQQMIIMSERVKPILRCTECGEERNYPAHCSEPMELTATEFVCTFKEHCGERIPIPSHCAQSMAVVITGKQE